MRICNIETARLLLREPVIEDSEIIFKEYSQDEEVLKYLTWKKHKKVDQTRNYISLCIDNNKNGEELTWSILLKDTKKLVGMITARIDGFKVNLGYVLGRNYWQQGYMSEAVQEVVRFLFTHNTIFRVDAVCDKENRGSRRVLEKCGFKNEGVLKRYIIHPYICEEPRDVYMFAAVK